ncbi:HupE/UreJ family protein [Tropicimonas sp. S265A]|uniref:HupE/UreJ family protein n=1 Tax=Tropicimonas sp. S265A TaxID=3415134 RepID=UPI003C79EAC4
MTRFFRAFLLALMLLCPAQQVVAHALEPGYLEVDPLEEGVWRITLRKPQVSGRPMGIDAVLPEGCVPRRGPPPRFDGRAYVTGWVAKCDPALSSAPLLIEGLDQTATDVLIRYTPEIGASAQTFRLTPAATSVVLADAPGFLTVLVSYFRLGMDHILAGIDHLLFVLGLLFLVSGTRALLLAITAFTVAHSITLTAATLGAVSLPMPPVEAAIALSIVFLAAEILRPAEAPPTLMQTAPWVVAFAFGLLHGLGFASALREIGLPEGDIPLAMVSFNVGVEAGQILFVCVVLAAYHSAKTIVPTLVERSRPVALPVLAYAIGGIAAYWTLDRVAGFFA